MKLSHSNSGVGNLTLLVFGSLLLAVLYTAYHVIPFYYYYYELVNQMEAAVKVASLETDAELRKKLTYHIRKMQLPVDPEELRIERGGDSIRISLRYSETFFIPWRDRDIDIHTFPFYAEAEGKI